jgi:hypothetical protein
MPVKFLVPFAALLLLTAGCGKKTSQKTSVGGVTVEQKGDVTTLEMKGKAGEPGMKALAGEKGVPRPAELPQDVPIFKDALIVSAVITGEVMQMKTTFKAPWAEAMQFYADQLKAEGWKVENVMNMGESGMVVAKLGKRQCTVMLGMEDKQPYAVISTNVAGK